MLLGDADGLELLAHAASALAQARVPPAAAAANALARMTALRKPDGGIRCIATGDVFRRLVSRALAKTSASTFDAATRPFQHAARSGMDALSPDVTVVSLDGRSAYDAVSRAAFLAKLRQVAPALLPFVRLFYGQPSVYCWWNDTGTCRDIHKAEGCEQGGDALAPLGQHEGHQALGAANDAANPLRSEGWHECPAWATLAHMTAQPPRAREAGSGDWPHGWQFHASRTRSVYFRDRVLLPTLEPAHRALLLSHSGPHAGAWLAAARSDTATSLPPEVMQIALRRRLRLQLPLGPGCCGQEGHGCRRRGDHALACTCTGLLARRAKLVERAWLQFAVRPSEPNFKGTWSRQQWLAHTSVPGVPSTDRRRLTPVSPVTGEGVPHPRAASTPSAHRRIPQTRHLPRAATRRSPTTLRPGCGGRRPLERGCARACAAARSRPGPPRRQPCARLPRVPGGTALGASWLFPRSATNQQPALDHVLALAELGGPSRLPLR